MWITACFGSPFLLVTTFLVTFVVCEQIIFYMIMGKYSIYCVALSAAALSSACSVHRAAGDTGGKAVVVAAERQRILVDGSFDAVEDAGAAAFMAPYRQKVDSMMSPVVGYTATAMKARRPESPLSNLLADVLVWAAAHSYSEHADLAVYNIGGIRASLPAGRITYGDVLEVAPFENKICFLTLSGANLMELFRQIASVGGEGLSRGVRLEISPEGNLLRAELHGRPVDPGAQYRIATIDYLAGGNDRMEAFKKKTAYVAPEGSANDMRVIISNFFRHKSSEESPVRAALEERIVVKQ